MYVYGFLKGVGGTVKVGEILEVLVFSRVGG